MSSVMRFIPVCCGRTVAVHNEFFVSYLKGASSVCSECRSRRNEWREVRACLDIPNVSFMALMPFGGESFMGQVTLPMNEVTTLVLNEYGVPSSARIRDVIFTQVLDASGSAGQMVHLFNSYGNDVRKIGSAHELAVLPKTSSGVHRGDAVFNLWIHFINQDEGLHRQLLIDAVFAFLDQDYRRAIIDLHTAVDVAFNKIVQQWLSPSHDGNKKPGVRINFLDKFTLVQRLVHTQVERSKAEHLNGRLKRLNSLRNQSAHPPGKADVSRDECAEMLTVGLFCIELTEAIVLEV